MPSGSTQKMANKKLFGAKRGDEALQEIEIRDEDRGGWRVEQEFINAIIGVEKVTHTPFDIGLKYMEFTEAVNRSMVEEKTFSLPL